MSGRIYIGRLSYQVRERDIERFFRGYGRIVDVLLKNGYGFVEFDDYRDADDAVYELNGKELCGERVLIEHARSLPRGQDGGRGGGGGGGGRDRGPPPQRRGGGRDRYGPPARTEYRLVVENLSSRVSWQDLKDYMRQAGEVTYADAHKQHKNEGIVEFATYSDLKNAIEKLDDTEINGRRIKLVEDRPRKSRRSRSRSRSRSSRSHSRSRSRSRRRRSRSRSKSRSRSRSRSKSPVAKKSRTKSRSRSRSRSRSPVVKKSRSRSRSPRSRSKSRSKSRSRSRSRSRSHHSHSRSRSKSPQENGEVKQDPEDNGHPGSDKEVENDDE